MTRAALLLAALLLAAAGRVPPAATPISRDTLGWWHARHTAKLAELRQGPVDLIFLGDSITQNYERDGPQPFLDFRPVWRRFYGDRHAVNLGFKGDATAHLLWRMTHGELDGIAPKAAVILIGANNFGHLHWSAADTALGIETVVAEARRRLPHTKLLLVGILPSVRSDYVTESTRAVNAALAARYGGGAVAGVTYIDVTPVFLADGAVNTSLFYDPELTPPDPPLHPTPTGQARMAEAIEPALSAMLGDRRH